MLASGLAGGLLACQLIVGVKDDDGAPRPDAAAPEAGEASAPCVLHKAPEPPTNGGGMGKGGLVYYALERLVIAPAEDAGAESVIGYDLDDRCTGLPTARSDAPCVTPDGGGLVTDEDGGVDNSLRRIFGSLSLLSSDTSDPGAAFFNKAIRAGTRTVLIALGDYNGEPDDTEVNVALFASEGLLPARDGGPVGDGLDEWTHTGVTQFLPAGPFLPVTGYVTRSVLVTRRADLVVAFGGFLLTLHDASITATIDPSGPGHLVNGTISGRAVADEVLAAAGQIPIENNYCLVSSFTGIKSSICDHRDLVHPDASPSETCDSVSVGIGFVAVRAVAKDVIKDASVEACAPLTCSP